MEVHNTLTIKRKLKIKVLYFNYVTFCVNRKTLNIMGQNDEILPHLLALTVSKNASILQNFCNMH